MNAYQGRRIAFELPEGFDEKIILGCEARRESANRTHGPSLVLLQRVLEPGEDLMTLSAQKLASLASTLAGFELLDRRDVAACGTRAVELLVRWQAVEGPLVQQITMLASGNLFFMITATSTDEALARCRASVQKLLSTLVFKEGGAR